MRSNISMSTYRYRYTKCGSNKNNSVFWVCYHQFLEVYRNTIVNLEVMKYHSREYHVLKSDDCDVDSRP
jgi:hypothetical protein